MKKINLNSTKDSLSRNEMRQVGGGSGGAYCRCTGDNTDEGYIFSCFWCSMACNGGGYICTGGGSIQ